MRNRIDWKGALIIGMAAAAMALASIGCTSPEDACPTACARAYGECRDITEPLLQAAFQQGLIDYIPSQVDCVDGCIDGWDTGGEQVASCLNDGQSCQVCAQQLISAL